MRTFTSRLPLFMGLLFGGLAARAGQTPEGTDSATLAAGSSGVPTRPAAPEYYRGVLLQRDDFENAQNWIIEQAEGGSWEIRDGGLEISDRSGCTAWFRHELSGRVLIEYDLTVRDSGRISDMNCFWMAAEADGSPPFAILGGAPVPKRSGRFAQYHNLRLYYVGCGGNANTTTRFRRYPGTGERPMLAEHDLRSAQHLLVPDLTQTYRVSLVACGKRVQYFRDGQLFFDITDPEPFTRGYFGIRLVNSNQRVSGLRIFRLELTGAAASDPASSDAGGSAAKPRILERLGRGLIAVPLGDDKAYVGWRLLGTDPDDVAFDLYRSTDGGTPVRLNARPIVATTDFVDTTYDRSRVTVYHVRALARGVAHAASSQPAVLSAGAPVRQYFAVPIEPPPPGEVEGQRYRYSANDASVGDLDGDGEYEIVVKWEPSNSKRPAQTGFTGPHILDAYERDGTRLWRINLGRNVRAGAAFTQFLVYDLDCDGRAELVCKTGDGTRDGRAKAIGVAEADWRNRERGSRIFGKVLEGPEYLTVFDGRTGAELASVEYVPHRYPIDGWGGVGGNGGNDATGNRVDHFSACVAYLDGVHPSAVMIRGWYGRTVAAAWDWRDGRLTRRWVFDSALPQWTGYSGMGNHSVTVADFDDDGRDEVNVGAMAIDDDGRGLFTTGLRHGDALHAGDLDPARPGLEVFGIHENEGRTVALGTPGSTLYDGKSGEIIWSNNPGVDVGRGLAADIDPNFPGAECWGAPGGTRRIDTGEVIYPQAPSSVNFAVWWDADLLRELADRTAITKWDWERRMTLTLLSPPDVASNNGTKATPCLTADLFGDWREEVIWRTRDNTELRIYTTTIPATCRIHTLMHDSQYRLAIAWQNVAYNQPPHPGFYIGPGMEPPSRPRIALPPATVERP